MSDERLQVINEIWYIFGALAMVVGLTNSIGIAMGAGISGAVIVISASLRDKS